VILAAVFFTGCGSSTTSRHHLPPLQTVPRVDLGRYLGTWYEISSFPQRFQKGCTGSMATYTARPGGGIDVTNRCHLGSLDGPEKVAVGQARVVDASSNAKLEVSFFRPFWGDYWIIALGDSYEYAVVGHPSRDYLWILARSPQMSPAIYAKILRQLTEQGYETSRLTRTVQPSSIK
jgi:apolipoprotein D and lipocalin family protein